MIITSDEQWLNNWRKGNRSLIHVNVYRDVVEKKQSHKWDLIRWSLRERFGDLALNKIRLIPANPTEEDQ